MAVKEEIERQFGRKALDRLVRAGELFDVADAFTEAFQALKARVAVLESRGIEFCGTWQRACEYRRGSVVSADGAMWVALRDTVDGEAPGKAPDAWQLTVKSARPVVRAKASGREQ